MEYFILRSVRRRRRLAVDEFAALRVGCHGLVDELRMNFRNFFSMDNANFEIGWIFSIREILTYRRWRR